MQFYEWDEFTHWGPIVKAMYLFDELGINSPVTLNNPHYPPALSVFSYLIVKIGGDWNEANVFWAYQLIFIALTIPLIKFSGYKKIFYFLTSICILVLGNLYFFNVFQTIYADALLSLVFGYTLVLASSENNKNRNWQNFNFLIALVVLVLIKDFGLILAFISIAVFGINSYFQVDEIVNLKRKISISVSNSFIALSVALGTRFTWSLFTNSGDLKQGSVGIVGGSTSRLATITDFGSEHYQNILKILLEKINFATVTWRGGIQMSTREWLLFLALLYCVSIIGRTRRQIKKDLLVALIFIGGAIGYFAALFIVYLTLFAPPYSYSLPSFERYISSFLGGILFFLIAVSLKQLQSFSDQIEKLNSNNSTNTFVKMPVLTVVMLLTMLIHSPTGYALNFYQSPSQLSNEIRSNFNNINEKIILSKFTVDDKIGIIAQHTQGFEYYVLQYEIMPASVIQTGFYTWSIGSPSDPGDVWTDQTITPEKWNDYLDKLNYVIIYKTTDSFIKEFGQFFEDPESAREQGIYRVIHSETGNRLVKHI